MVVVFMARDCQTGAAELGHDRTLARPGYRLIGDAPDRPGLAFQLAPGYRPPAWPDPASPQQMHLDVRVDDLDQAEAAVLALGARTLPGGGDTFRVFTDPAGHPFCLVAF
jgi:hypothetical protein